MSEQVIFFKRNDTLTHQEDQYYQDLFYRVLKIGTELEFAVPRGVNAKDFRQKVELLLNPSRNLENLGDRGIFDVVKEHCGIEVQIIGRHPHWNSLLQQYREIIAILLKEKVRMRPTCGLHFHLIAVGLSEHIPQIVLANLWNLVRRHAPGLKFMFSGGNVPEGICRRRQNNSHQEFLNNSPNSTDMSQIKEVLKKSLIVPEHQNLFNLEHLVFNGNGHLKNFHIEMRFPDGDLVPTSIVAKTFLFFALALKAVEISKYGLIHPGTKTQWERKKELMDMLSNNDGDLARSDTSRIGEREIKELQDNALDLLLFLKSIFNKFTNPTYNVLKSLVYQPISLRRIEGKDWQTIEHGLSLEADYPFFIDDIDKTIIKNIELGLELNKKSSDDWLASLSVKTNVSKKEIKKRINSYIEKYPAWDRELGSFVFRK